MNLIERVAFDAPSGDPDGLGGTVPGWDAVFSTRAQFLFLRGGEKIQAGRLSGTQPVVVTVRKTSQTEAVKGSWSIRDIETERRYMVRTITPNRDKPRQYLDILCESVHEG